MENLFLLDACASEYNLFQTVNFGIPQFRSPLATSALCSQEHGSDLKDVMLSKRTPTLIEYLFFDEL